MNKDKQLTYKECQRRMDAESNIGFQLYKRRLKKALSSQRKEIVEKIEKKKGRDMPTFDKKVWLELLDKKEIINLITKEDE